MITPRFKQGNFETGIREGMQNMILVADGTIGESDISSSSGDDFPIWGFMLFWFGIVGLFTFMGIFTPGCSGWGLYVFLIPFYIGPAAIISDEMGSPLGWFIILGYLILYPLLRVIMPKTAFGKKMATKLKSSGRAGVWSSGGWSSSSSSGWSSGGGSSFSGGGGSFGGGGSSGSW